MSDVLRTLSSAYRSALGRVGLLGSQRRSPDDRVPRSSPRGRLFRKYVLLIVGLVSLVLLLNSALDFWFSYEENKAGLFRIQQEKAGSAARRIEQFVDEIERQLGWTTAPQWAASPLEQRRFDYVRLLRQAPAITELIQLDDTGKEQLKVSRLAMDVVGSEKDYSEAPSFIEAKKNRVWFSPVYFRKESEPYMTVALARAGRNAGVTVAEVNLKLIWDVITGLKIGQGGYAYVVDREGRLIAHPDISLVLRNTDLTNLPQVASALAGAPSLPSPAGGGGSGWGQPIDQAAMVAKGINGNSVLTAHAAIAPLGWTVFVELPLSEALAPLYGSALRTAALLALALVLATSAALLLARRMTVPIRQLQAGAARIGAGELNRRIEIHTGDELEGLAGDFNRMAADLQKSYADLEKRVEDRTAELAEALDQQTATAEVLGVINSSPGDLTPVFDAILEKAHSLCGAAKGALVTYDGERFRGVATRGLSEPYATMILEQRHNPPGSPLDRLLQGEPLVHVPDFGNLPFPIPRAAAELEGARTVLFIPLRKDSALLGYITAYRQEVRAFSEKQIALLQNFAAQAVIAMENARLIIQTREALEQQTATAEVLGVINSSPGDLAPVFDAMLAKATALCEAAFGTLATYDGERFVPAAAHGVTPAFAAFRDERGAFAPPPGSSLERVANGESLVHIADVMTDPGQAATPLVKLGGCRTLVCVALRKDNHLMGAITAYRQEVRPFTDKQIALLQNFAAQAVIAIENARLIRETREALEQQTATAEVLQVINSSPSDLTPVFSAILEKAHGLCGVTFGTLQLYDGEKFRAVATRGFPKPLEKVIHEPYAPGLNSPLLGLINGGRFVQIRDLAEHDTLVQNPRSRVAVDLGIRALLFLPLRKDNLLLGLISAARTEAKLFSEREIALLENFAAQAVIAMENARLLTETREALEQQTATAEVLQVINSSPGDLAPVFDAMLGKALHLCEAAFGLLHAYDGERFRALAVGGVSGAAAEPLREWVADPGSALEQIVRGDRVVHIPDVIDTDAYRSGVASRLKLVRLTGARTALWVALRKDDALLGVFVIYRREARPFADKQIALLQNFAAQAVIAMENARLITETREALEQQTATAEVLRTIANSPAEAERALDTIAQVTGRLFGASSVNIRHLDGNILRYAASFGAGAAEFRAAVPEAPLDPNTLPGCAILEKRQISVEDTHDPAVRERFPSVLSAGSSRTRVATPLLREGEAIGAIVTSRAEVRAFTEKELTQLANFADQAVIAIENTRLITETREALEQQTATAEVLQVINSSPGDLAPVFDAMLEKAMRLCGAAFGVFAIYDEEHYRVVANHGVPLGLAEFVRQAVPIHPGSMPDRLRRGEDTIQVADITALGSELRTPGLVAMIELGNARTAVWVALRKDGIAQGFFGVYRQEVRPFTEKQIALLQNFAAQAVIAMENARLITETREALEQQTATAEVLQVINSSPGDLAPIFEAILDKARAVCGFAHGSLNVYDGAYFRTVAMHGYPEAFAEVLRQPRRTGPQARFLEGDRIVHITDVAADRLASDDPVYRAAIEAGVRTVLFVPLRNDQRLLGYITANRREVRPFSEKEIALLENFAAQAVIAMENARLITETREALEQQTATAEVLGVINASPGDLAPVFDAVLEKATRFCDAAFGTLWTYDGECFQAVALRQVPEAYAEFLSRAPIRPVPFSGLGRVAAGESVAHFVDVAANEAYRGADPGLLALLDLGKARSTVAVPLRKDDAILGAITAYRQEVRPFSDKQIALLQNFAAHAVIAMENARLITETREALEQQTATAEVLGVINGSPGDLAPVFDAILEKAHSLCEAAFGTLMIRDGERFYPAVLHGVPAPFEEVLRRGFRPHAGTPLARLLSGERLIHIADLAQVAPLVPDDPVPRAGVELGGTRTLLMVPLRKDGAMLGAITAFRQEVRPFTDRQITLLQNFAAQAVIAMENARLITETREALDQQTATAEVLQVINSSPGDLAPVFDAMLEKAMRLCEAAFGTLWTYDGACVHAAALHNVPPVFAEFLTRAPHQVGPDSAHGRLLGGEPVVHIPDIVAERAYQLGDPIRRALVELGGGRTLLAVPLRKDNTFLGDFVIYRQEARPFSGKQIALLQSFAAQAVIAMENARLLGELRQRTHDLQESLEYQTATSDVLKVISRSGAELEPVLDMLVETAARICQADKAFVNQLRDGLYRTSASFGFSAEYKSFMIDNPIAPGRGTVTGRVALESRVIQIEDVASDPEYSLRGWEAQWRTGLGVPLFRGATVIGVIFLARSRVEPFTEKQIELVTTFADQAVIAIENARLLGDLQGRTHDLQESLEYQTATSDVLKVISRSTFDLQPVLETLTETAARLCEADTANIMRREGDVYRAATAFGFSPEYKAFMESHPFPPGRGSITGRVALEGRAVHVADVENDPEYAWTEGQQIGKFRTMLGVPLLREDTLIGVLGLYRSRVEPFTVKQIALVTTFADQAVIAIENARLFNELRARTTELGSSVAELKMLNEVAQAVSSTLDLRTVLSTVLNASLGVTWANAGAVFRYSRAERAFRLVEAVGWDEALAHSVRELHVAEAETAMGEAAARRTPIQLAELAERPSAPLRDASLAAGFHSALIVPLVGAERILGAIILMRQEAGEFPAETVRLMQTLASQSVLAIQNARLFREIADKSEQLALASQHKSQFLANMSHELRTPLNAILGYAELLVDGIYGVLPDRPKGVLDRIQNNGKHLLALINDVLDLAKIEAGQLTLTLEDYSVPEVVKSVVTATEPLATSKGLKFTAALQDDLPMAHGDARRVSQVLLNLVGNAIKFTDEGEVEIGAIADKGQFVLTVRDTGPGIADADQERIFGEFQQIDNSNTRKKGGTGLGLAISKRMVEMQGGTISVESVLGEGSTFRVVLPVHVDEMMEEAA